MPYVCSYCKNQFRRVDGAEAARLYDRLRRHLRVVRSFGCYLPHRAMRLALMPIFNDENGTRSRRYHAEHERWPLHAWYGPSSFPLVLTWTSPAAPGPLPTFQEFCRVYGLEVVGQ